MLRDAVQDLAVLAGTWQNAGGTYFTVAAPGCLLDANSACLLVNETLESDHLVPSQLTYAEAGNWWWETLDSRAADAVHCWDRFDEISFAQTHTALERSEWMSDEDFRPLSVSIPFPPGVSDVLDADVLLALWYAFLSRYRTSGSMVVGLVDDGRFLEEMQEIIGPLTRVLPLSFPVSDESSLNQIVAEASRHRQTATEFSDYFHLEDDDILQYQFEWRSETFAVVSHADVFRLKLLARQRHDALRLELAYDPVVIDAPTIDEVAQRFSDFIAGSVARPTRSVGHFGILKHQAPVPSGQTLEESVPRAFAASIAAHPDDVAISGTDGSLTYLELDRESAEVAWRLVALDVGSGHLVGLALPRGVHAIAAMLGVLKAGAAFVPLDVMWPAARLRDILLQSGAHAVICPQDLTGILDGVSHVTPPFAETHRTEWNDVAIFPDSPAYVLYTSGSTGQPKGVINTHRGVLSLVAALQERILGPLSQRPLRIAVAAALSFDASVQQIFSSLILGHHLVVIPAEIKRDPVRLVEFLEEQQINVCDGTPALLNLLTENEQKRSKPSALRHMIIGGETLAITAVRNFQSSTVGSGVTVTNIYGLTESAVDSLAFTVRPGESIEAPTVPIGTALSNSEVWLLNDCLELVPDLAIGQLYIGGPCLALGYRNDPVQTADRFIPNPFRAGERLLRTGDRARRRIGGQIVFEGRADAQVKIRGHRVETGEIATVLSAHTDVGAAIVLPRETSGGLELAGFYAGVTLPQPQEMRRYLQALLPEYMIPRWLTPVARLPLNASGKPDRDALLALLESSRSHGHFEDQPWQSVASIWAHVLDTPRLAANDNFFDRGGHSLLALRAVARMTADLGTHFQLHQLYEHPTPQDFYSAVICGQSRGPFEAELILLPPIVGVPSVFDDLTSGCSGRLETHGLAYHGATTLDELVEGITQRILQRVSSPYMLAGHSFGAIVCFEVAKRIESLGHKTRIVLLDRPVHAPVSAQPPIIYWNGVPEQERPQLEERVQIHRDMAASYVATGEIRGGLLAIEAKDGAHSARMGDWRSKTSGDFRHELVPGDHDSMVRAPHAKRVADLLVEWFLGAARRPS